MGLAWMCSSWVLVQSPVDVLVCVYLYSLFGIYKLDVHGSVHHSINYLEITNKMQPCIRILLFQCFLLLSIFWATHCSSSGAQKLYLQPLVLYTAIRKYKLHIHNNPIWATFHSIILPIWTTYKRTKPRQTQPPYSAGPWHHMHITLLPDQYLHTKYLNQFLLSFDRGRQTQTVCTHIALLYTSI
jgi:hypothetical protein